MYICVTIAIKISSNVFKDGNIKSNSILIDGEELLIFHQCDIRDKDGIELILTEFPDISSCIQFAE